MQPVSKSCFRISSLCAIALVGHLALTGCQSSPDDVSYGAIKRDLTPELITMHETHVDADRNMRTAGNQNLRMMFEDLGRFFLLDNPSTLRPNDPIFTSGNPR